MTKLHIATACCALFVSCKDKGTDSAPTAEYVPADGCTVDEGAFPNITTSESDIATVFRVTFDSTADADVVIRFASDEDLMYEAFAGRVDGAYSVTVRGVPASTEVHYRLFTVEDDPVCSELHTYSTGSLGSGLPTLQHTGDDDSSFGFVSMPLLTEDSYFLTVVDAKGRPVWAKEMDRLPFRLEFEGGTRGLWFNAQATSADTTGAIELLDWEGRRLASHEIVGHHTDFTVADDGTIYALGWDLREVEDEGVTRKILGDTIVSIDSDGTQATIWSSWDQFELDLNAEWDEGIYQADPEVESWTHVNGISYDAFEDALLITIPHLETVASIDRRTGELRWALGDHDQVLATDQPQPVDQPHSAYRIDQERVVIFNRLDGGGCSRADTFKLDFGTKSATLESSYDGDDCLGVYYLGMARPVSNGRMLVAWTTSGRIDQVGADGTLEWSLVSKLGAGVAYSDQSPSLYGE